MLFFWVLAPCKLVARALALKMETVYPFRNVGIYRRVCTASKPRRPALSNTGQLCVGNCFCGKWPSRCPMMGLLSTLISTKSNPRSRESEPQVPDTKIMMMSERNIRNIKRFGMFPFKVQVFRGFKSETEIINTKSVVQHVIRYQVLLAAYYKNVQVNCVYNEIYE
jgi:hypothetical protein